MVSMHDKNFSHCSPWKDSAYRICMNTFTYSWICSGELSENVYKSSNYIVKTSARLLSKGRDFFFHLYEFLYPIVCLVEVN